MSRGGGNWLPGLGSRAGRCSGPPLGSGHSRSTWDGGWAHQARVTRWWPRLSPGRRGQQAVTQLTLTPPVHIRVTRPRPSTPSCLPVGPGDEVLPRGAPAPVQPSEGQGTGLQAGGTADVRGRPQGRGARRPRCSPAQAPAAPQESRDKGSSLSEGRLLSSRGTARSQRASPPFYEHLWVAQAGQQDEQAWRHRDPSEPGLVENRKGAQGGDGPASPTPGAPRGEPWAMDLGDGPDRGRRQVLQGAPRTDTRHQPAPMVPAHRHISQLGKLRLSTGSGPNRGGKTSGAGGSAAGARAAQDQAVGGAARAESSLLTRGRGCRPLISGALKEGHPWRPRRTESC